MRSCVRILLLVMTMLLRCVSIPGALLLCSVMLCIEMLARLSFNASEYANCDKKKPSYVSCVPHDTIAVFLAIGLLLPDVADRYIEKYS